MAICGERGGGGASRGLGSKTRLKNQEQHQVQQCMYSTG